VSLVVCLSQRTAMCDIFIMAGPSGNAVPHLPGLVFINSVASMVMVNKECDRELYLVHQGGTNHTVPFSPTYNPANEASVQSGPHQAAEGVAKGCNYTCDELTCLYTNSPAIVQPEPVPYGDRGKAEEARTMHSCIGGPPAARC